MRDQRRLLAIAVTSAALFAPACSGSAQPDEWTGHTSSSVSCASVGLGVHPEGCFSPPPGGGIHPPPIVVNPPSPANGGTGPITLASGVSLPLGIAVDALNVYYGDGLGTLRAIPKDGGTPVPIATEQGFINGIALDYQSFSPTVVGRIPEFSPSVSDGVFFASVPDVFGVWIDPETGAASGTPRLAGTGTTPFAVAVDFVNVYWTDPDTGANGPAGDGLVIMAPVRGGPPVTLHSGGTPWGIAADATNVYWVDQDCCVMMKPIAGGPAVELASGLTQAVYLALDSTPTPGSNAKNVYWTDGWDVPGGVWTVPVTGGTPKMLAGGSPSSIAVDSTAVYWADWGTDTIDELPFGADVPTVLASNQELDGYQSQIAVDSANVYWIAEYTTGATNLAASGRVMKVAK